MQRILGDAVSTAPIVEETRSKHVAMEVDPNPKLTTFKEMLLEARTKEIRGLKWGGEGFAKVNAEIIENVVKRMSGATEEQGGQKSRRTV